MVFSARYKVSTTDIWLWILIHHTGILGGKRTQVFEWNFNADVSLPDVQHLQSNVCNFASASYIQYDIVLYVTDGQLKLKKNETDDWETNKISSELSLGLQYKERFIDVK